MFSNNLWAMTSEYDSGFTIKPAGEQRCSLEDIQCHIDVNGCTDYGFVEFSFKIGHDGHAIDLIVERSVPAIVFEAEAKKAISKLRWSPRETPEERLIFALRFCGQGKEGSETSAN